MWSVQSLFFLSRSAPLSSLFCHVLGKLCGDNDPHLPQHVGVDNPISQAVDTQPLHSLLNNYCTLASTGAFLHPGRFLTRLCAILETSSLPRVRVPHNHPPRGRAILAWSMDGRDGAVLLQPVPCLAGLYPLGGSICTYVGPGKHVLSSF